MPLVTVVMDLETELVPGLPKHVLRAIVKRTEELTDVNNDSLVSQQSLDLAADVEAGIAARDRRKREYKQEAAAASAPA